MSKKYITLLEAITKNSKSLKMAALVFFEKGIKTKNAEERIMFVVYAINLLFACMDEMGKFYLIKSQYPKKIDSLDLSLIGFYRHDDKLRKIISIVRERQKSMGSSSPFSDDETLKFLRKFKDTTLYVDYKDGKIVSPQDSVILKRDVFQGYINIIKYLEEMMSGDFELFKRGIQN